MTVSLPCPCWTGNCANCRPELHTRLADGSCIDNVTRTEQEPAERVETAKPDKHGNVIAVEGCDRCECGAKYWEKDHCVDCGRHVVTGFGAMFEALDSYGSEVPC